METIPSLQIEARSGKEQLNQSSATIYPFI